ncbi:MAG: cell division protein FtsZ, partial [Desulfocapsa sp.]|nr:cell division protein FtsZ [Desulfocapsa sp.]
NPTDATPNRGSGNSIFPSSNFNGFENHGISSGDSQKTGKESRPWNEELLETPTYLRKKAN